jgi:hypothetical protein
MYLDTKTRSDLETFTFLNEFTKETSDTFVTKPRAEYMKRMKRDLQWQ